MTSDPLEDQPPTDAKENAHNEHQKLIQVVNAILRAFSPLRARIPVTENDMADKWRTVESASSSNVKTIRAMFNVLAITLPEDKKEEIERAILAELNK